MTAGGCHLQCETLRGSVIDSSDDSTEHAPRQNGQLSELELWRKAGSHSPVIVTSLQQSDGPVPVLINTSTFTDEQQKLLMLTHLKPSPVDVLARQRLLTDHCPHRQPAVRRMLLSVGLQDSAHIFGLHGTI